MLRGEFWCGSRLKPGGICMLLLSLRIKIRFSSVDRAKRDLHLLLCSFVLKQNKKVNKSPTKDDLALSLSERRVWEMLLLTPVLQQAFPRRCVPDRLG